MSQGDNQRLSRASRDVIFGSIIEHPFDLIKVRLQTQPMHPVPQYAGAFDCFRKLVAAEGVKGLFSGVSMPLLGATLENATLFVTYNQVQHVLRVVNGIDEATALPFAMLGVAAGASGAMTGFVLTPFELIKCKMQVQTMAGGAVRSPISLIAQVVRESGPSGLWLGLSGTLLRETGGGVAWFLTFEAITKNLVAMHKKTRPSFEKKDLSAPELMVSGAASGIAYNTSLFPADTVKSAMQTERELGGTGAKTGFWKTFLRIYRTRGIAGLYAGLGVTCLRSAPSSALVFYTYNKLEHLFDHYEL
ncbi:mitochondrial ornithine carrier protein [Malassezia cuniculi]|uniref:Mitochondrial ornithine carrier protein n=1 Tax=Malassezia cuniculi TaxID=948313 RepID=A0AAF0ENP6_9BASI|nr:mitochondrial ornithine carrier protein [Malassezia cuniculi]